MNHGVLARRYIVISCLVIGVGVFAGDRGAASAVSSIENEVIDIDLQSIFHRDFLPLIRNQSPNSPPPPNSPPLFFRIHDNGKLLSKTIYSKILLAEQIDGVVVGAYFFRYKGGSPNDYFAIEKASGRGQRPIRREHHQCLSRQDPNNVDEQLYGIVWEKSTFPQRAVAVVIKCLMCRCWV